MSLPPPMPVQRRATIVLILLGLLVVAGAIAGFAPLMRRWFGDWAGSGS